MPLAGPLGGARPYARGMRLLDNDRALTRLARAGCAARGTVYAVIGVLALRLALGDGGAAVGPRDALREVADAPFGRAALAVISVGLAAFAAWRLIDGARDVEGNGSRW